jgi:SAM-dependent methyltransferase
MRPGERWDERYRRAGLTALPAAPPAWLVEHRDLLPGGGRALDLASGPGRAARYLAELGYDVLAVDASDVVVGALRDAAREQGLAVEARVVDLEREPIPPGPYDLIAVFMFLQRDLFGPVQDALAPGGLLFHETFDAGSREDGARSVNPAYVLERDELLRAYPALEVLDHRSGVMDREGGRSLSSLVARRPG